MICSRRLCRSGVAALLGLLLAGRLAAADFDMRLSLPDAEWLRPAASPPQFQREGQPLPSEQDLVNRVLEHIGREEPAAALDFLRQQRSTLLDAIEQGDPAGVARRAVVAGGFMPVTRSGQTSAAVLYLLGHVYRALERPEAAELSFRLALEGLPDYLRVHETLGLMYLESGRYTDAQARLAHAAALGLNTAQLWGALGYLNQQLDNHWGAAAAYQQAMMLEHDNRNWQRGLLYALAETRQHQAGRALVEQMLQTQVDETALWLFHANFALQAEARQDALASLETALRLGERTPANLQVAATLHLERGSVARAVELLADGLAQGLDYVYVDQALQWLAQQGERAALRQLLTAAEAGRDSLEPVLQSRLLTRRATLALQEQDDSSARTALQEALALDPGNADALLGLADLQRAARNYPQAELLYQRARAYDSHRERASLQLAQLAIDQGDYARALDLLREIQTRNPARSDLARNIDTLENLVSLQQ
jgi:tetratricopeptide (TPR) repeat protein